MFAFVLGIPATALADKTMSLSTGSFEFKTQAGGKGQGRVVVMNDGSEPINVLVYTANQLIDSQGGASYVAPSVDDPSSLQSPASWIQVHMPDQSKAIGNVPYVYIRPGEKLPVSFNFTTPSNVPPGDHQIILFFEMFELSKVKKGAVSQLSGRLGARIRIRVKGTLVEQLDVRPFSVPLLSTKSDIPWSFTARNSGNIDKRVDVALSVLDRNENERFRSQVLTQTSVYAGKNLVRSGVLKTNGLIGPFKVRLTTSYVKDGTQVTEQIVKDRTVWFLPVWLLVVLGAMVFIGLLAIVWVLAGKAADRRAQKRRERRGSGRGEGRPRRSAPAEEPAARAGRRSDLWVSEEDLELHPDDRDDSASA